MRRAAATVLGSLAAFASLSAPAAAQTVRYGIADAQSTWTGLPPTVAGEGGVNAFFYPDGYDPQYGSEGRLADAADFADGYGCLPVWDAKYGQYVEACNGD